MRTLSVLTAFASFMLLAGCLDAGIRTPRPEGETEVMVHRWSSAEAQITRMNDTLTGDTRLGNVVIVPLQIQGNNDWQGSTFMMKGWGEAGFRDYIMGFWLLDATGQALTSWEYAGSHVGLQFQTSAFGYRLNQSVEGPDTTLARATGAKGEGVYGFKVTFLETFRPQAGDYWIVGAVTRVANVSFEMEATFPLTLGGTPYVGPGCEWITGNAWDAETFLVSEFGPGVRKDGEVVVESPGFLFGDWVQSGWDYTTRAWIMPDGVERRHEATPVLVLEDGWDGTHIFSRAPGKHLFRSELEAGAPRGMIDLLACAVDLAALQPSP